MSTGSAFDAHHPPDPELIEDCVHCGFCLPTCPTYALWGEEMDSPRGRIYLMNMAERGEIPLDGAFTTHIDRCLGCMACVTSCPSGVQYDSLLEATRRAVGWRDVLDIHEEQKEVTKTVGGKTHTETKTWKYFQLSEYRYLNYVEVLDAAEEVGAGLLELGVTKDDVFNNYAQTR